MLFEKELMKNEKDSANGSAVNGSVDGDLR